MMLCSLLDAGWMFIQHFVKNNKIAGLFAGRKASFK